MPIAKKAMITLAAALISTGFSAASFAALDISGVAGESSDFKYAEGIDSGGGSTPVPVSVCFYVFGASICIPTS
jgi:hypothetical protein